ncbi:hypothetical protein [Nocardioides sp. Kera G14]|uniref:hypothetical protein n=1 Tax=Nocardioides sp. Kera G14 TaxID=2884264 RepID=UPI001D10F02D|nr:hypothetical protein [Nocardioides sp. Kera G14]UDY23732.1 hypothetical protein LH076_00080 [Nocardioides sp. Kera G14]
MDTSPLSDPHGGELTRLAWLLGTHRLTTQDGLYASRTRFLPDLSKVCPGLSCDDSGVSRWESGARQPSAVALAGYEKVLALPDRSLRAIAVLLQPNAPSLPGPRVASGYDGRLGDLIDLVVDGQARGADWLEFAEELLRHGPIFMRPGVWEGPCARLIEETARSLHAGYLTRRAAVRLLLAHPTLRAHVLEAINGYLARPGAPRRADIASLLRFAPPVEGSRRSVEKARSDDAASARGATRAAAALLAHGLFDDAALPELTDHVAVALGTSPEDIHVTDLFNRLPPAARDEVSGRLGPAGPPATGELVPVEIAGSVAISIAAEAQAAAPVQVRSEPDRMFQRLLREALFHPHAERRAESASLLMMSPYQPGLGHALASALEKATDETLPRIASLLRCCLTNAQAPVLFGLLGSETPNIRAHALTALGNCPKPLSEREITLLRGMDWSTARQQESADYAIEMHAPETGRELLTA